MIVFTLVELRERGGTDAQQASESQDFGRAMNPHVLPRNPRNPRNPRIPETSAGFIKSPCSHSHPPPKSTFKATPIDQYHKSVEFRHSTAEISRTQTSFTISRIFRDGLFGGSQTKESRSKEKRSKASSIIFLHVMPREKVCPGAQPLYKMAFFSF